MSKENETVLKNASSICLFATFLWAMTVPASSHEGATGIVKERMMQMKSMGKASKELAAIAKGEAPLDADRIRALAVSISEESGEKMTVLFPDGSLDHPTEALPAIWQDWATFSRHADELKVSAQAMANNAGENLGDFQTRLRTLANTCRACHDDFREK